MKIHVTKTGQVIVVCFIIGVAIFLMCGGYAVIAKLIETHRVNAIPPLADSFTASDISYHNMQTLRNSFSTRHNELKTTIANLKELRKSYPGNPEIESKLRSYETYRASMENSSFDCPEHTDKGRESRYKNCPDCWSWSSSLLCKCGTCGGTNKIKYSVDVSKKCPNCDTIYKSQIPANLLLN